jgi:tetratricopeptide (TPR) repeat protein
MPRRYFNWKLAIVLLIGLIVLGATAFGLRRWQRSGRAEQGLVLGNKAYDEHKWEEAAQNLGRYIAVKGDDVPALLKYADAQLKIRPLKSNNLRQALEAYRIVMRIDKNNREAALRLTGLYMALNTPGEAGLIAGNYLKTNNDPEIRRILAASLAVQRKFEEAATELKNIIAEHPEQILAYELLGQLTEQRRESFPDPPERWFDEAIKNNPSSALAYICRAGFYLRNQQAQKALTDLEQAEKLDLSDPTVRLRLAGGFITANVLDKAEQQLMAVQKLTPTDYGLWQTWAQLAQQSRSKEKILTVAEAALKELSSQPWDFMPTAAELFIRAGDLDRATDCISKLRQKDITPETVAFLEGLVADQKGQTLEAVRHWQRAIQLGNKGPRVRLALASALFRLGDTQSSLNQLRTLVSERPDLSEGHLALARLLDQIGSWPEAAKYAQSATQLSRGNLEAILLYLQARMKILATDATSDNTQWEEIKKQLLALEEATKGYLEVKLMQLRFAILQRNFTDAETLLAQLKKDHPAQLRIALAEVDLFIAQGKTNEAISKLNETIKEFRDAVEPIRILALLLYQQAEREKCETTIKEALARFEQPITQRELTLLLVDLYSQWNQTDKAYPLLSELATKIPNDIPIKRRLLTCEQVIKNPEKTQQLVDEIKSIDGEDGWQWRYEQARAWYISPDFEKRRPQIISLLQENLLANPNDQASRLLLAATYDRGGDTQMALSTYRQALDRSPKDMRIIAATVAALYKAKGYDDQEAQEILNRASREKLLHPQLQQLQFESYVRQGEFDSASYILEDIISRDPNNPALLLTDALIKMQQNKFDKAAQLLDKLKTLDPNSMSVIVAQIQLNLQQKKTDEALALCNKIVKDLNNASAYVLRARTFAALRQTDKAIADLEHAIAIEPNNVEVWITRSDFYYSAGQLDKAEADIQQALSLAPNNPQIQKRAALLLLASGNAEKTRQAKSILDKALESNPDDAEIQILKARSLLAEGTAPSIENAAKILQKVTEDQPKISEAWALLGEIFFRQGEPGKAIDIALRGLVYKANDKPLLILKARAEAARSPVLAIPTLRVLLDTDPNDTDTVVLLANMYVATGETQKAVELLRNHLKVCKDAVRRKCSIALAVALYKNENKGEAQTEFDSLFESEPNDAIPLLTQARLLKDDRLWSQLSQSISSWYQKHPKDITTPVAIARELAVVDNSEAKKIAEDILKMILNQEPNSIEAINVLAILLQATNQPEESAGLYQRILTLQPNNVVAMNNLAWIMCVEQGKFQQALELAEKALKIAPDYLDVIDTHGVIYLRMGEFNKAVQDFTTCIKLYPASNPSAATSRLHLAKALAALREKDKALDLLNQILNSESQTRNLSPRDLIEARNLLDELSKGGKGG